ncbi:DNA-directed RNA polymerase III subunit RPC7-like [Galendromus occidentalis]|uniref:DNA-directed RNA polymerase III subunit RPC7-like n=1 Tax=Galendromus occidentalis TaxID=34638 RepID=A0AAJ6QN94_9ACAR|nr:DNA-directed RNA polymerase III subunit RPC7-like [Galendromus occidentalis]
MPPKPKSNSSIDVARLGFTKGESLPQIQTAPPPLYPPLSQKPVPGILEEEMKTIATIYDRLRTEIREDAFHVRLAEEKPAIERYSDQLDYGMSERKYDYRMELFPAVLTTKTKKKVVKKAKDINLDKVLSEDKDHDEEKGENEEEAEDEEGQNNEDDADEGVDDDYADTYFDNGENFLDPDDDALEESAVF